MRKDKGKYWHAVCFIVVFCFFGFLGMFELAKGAQSEKPRYGGTFRYCDQIEGQGIGYPPKYSEVTYSTRQAAPALERLLRVDKAGKLVPHLASGFKENVKAKTITLTLRKGVKFHDGTDFNAEAVKWNLDQFKAAGNQAADKFRSVDVVDNYTVRINLTEWDNTVTSHLSHGVSFISPTAYKKNGEAWATSHPVGTGPFQFVSWDKGNRITYKKFDGYWQKGKPYLDRVEMAAIGDQLTRQISFRKGEFHIAVSLAAKDLPTLEKEGYVVTRARTGCGSYGLVPDSANPKSPFADIRVRRAVQYAIDTNAIVQAVLHGENDVANQYVPKTHWAYNPSIVGYPYNPRMAKQLLTEAGYPNGFKTKITYRVVPEWEQIYTAVQGYLQAVGIEAILEPVQMPRYTQIAYQGGSWEGLIHNTVSSNTDVAAFLKQRYSGDGKFYTQMALPPDYIEAIQKAITAANFEDKAKWSREALKLMIDKYCLQIMIYSPADFTVSQLYAHNHGVMETPNNTIWRPEDAWVEK